MGHTKFHVSMLDITIYKFNYSGETFEKLTEFAL